MIGGKGVGKSTMSKYLLNTVLSSSVRQEEEKEDSLDNREIPPSCSLLDLDVACPEHSLPGTVTLARHTKPLVGNTFLCTASNSDRRLEYEELQRVTKGDFYSKNNVYRCNSDNIWSCSECSQILLGSDKLLDISIEYVGAAARLMNVYNEFHKKEVLIVNTTALENAESALLLYEIMKVVNPTHVVHIAGRLGALSQNPPMTSEHVNSEMYKEDWYNGGLNAKYLVRSYNSITKYFKTVSNVNYEYIRVPSVSQSYKTVRHSGQLSKDILITSYLSPLWPYCYNKIDSISCQNALTVKWSNIALNIYRNPVNNSSILRAINGKLVALCHIHPKYITKISPDWPQLVTLNQNTEDVNHCNSSSQNTDTASNFNLNLLNSEPLGNIFDSDTLFTCHGWAVVKGIDMEKKELHLLTPEPATIMLTVNALVRTSLLLPAQFNKLFYRGKSPA